MTAPGRYAASGGSFAKSAGSAAARGGVLIAIAVVIGFALLAWGFDGGDSDASVGPAADDTATDDTATDDGTTTDDTATDDGTTTDDTATDDGTTTDDTVTDGTTTDDTTTDDTATPAVDDPSSIKVAVLNATGVGGLAGERAATLGALNYVTTAGNAVGSPLESSKVYFVTGFGDEAKIVAAALSGPSSVLELAPDDPASLESGDLAAAGEADIIVVLGTDNVLK